CTTLDTHRVSVVSLMINLRYLRHVLHHYSANLNYQSSCGISTLIYVTASKAMDHGQIRNRFGSAKTALDETTAHRPKSQSPHRTVYLRLRIVQTRAKQGKSPETLRRCGEDR